MGIKWNQELFGVEIKYDANHFVVSAQPSMVMDWDDAVRFYKDNKVWHLPTRKQLLLIANNIDEINTIIKANGGYEIRSGWYRTDDECDEFCAWYVHMYGGYTSYNLKSLGSYVRAVSNL